jgi:signal transduction histidine kinase
VKQILAFSRQSESEKRALKMELIVREAVKLIRAGIPSTIAIDQRIDPDLNMVLADPTHIHQIAMNLMTNAFHAMEESGGVMTVRLERVEIALSDIEARHLDLVPGDYLCFSVSDTGLGMDKRVLDRIFEPYFTTKPEGKGTGLGLSVVHGIVKSLKGHIHVKSDPGEGSVFTVYLPVFNATEKRLPGF